MPLTLRVDQEARRLYSVATGTIHFEDILAHLQEEVAQGVLGYPELVDAGTATTDLSGDQVRHLAMELTTMARRHPLGPAAIIVSADYFFGLVRMFGTLLESVTRVGAFRDEAAARAWLDQESGT